jgi:hypothetical protein
MPKIDEKLNFLIRERLRSAKNHASTVFLRIRVWILAKLAVKFVQKTLNYCNLDKIFVIIAELEDLVA